MRFAGFISGVLIAIATSHAEPRLRMLPASSNGWATVQGETSVSPMFITLSASSNLTHWETIAELPASRLSRGDDAAVDGGGLEGEIAEASLGQVVFGFGD